MSGYHQELADNLQELSAWLKTKRGKAIDQVPPSKNLGGGLDEMLTRNPVLAIQTEDDRWCNLWQQMDHAIDIIRGPWILLDGWPPARISHILALIEEIQDEYQNSAHDDYLRLRDALQRVTEEKLPQPGEDWPEPDTVAGTVQTVCGRYDVRRLVCHKCGVPLASGKMADVLGEALDKYWAEYDAASSPEG